MPVSRQAIGSPRAVADVIIRTYCSAERRQTLVRAVESLLQQTVPVRPIIVVNGDRRDPALVAQLRADARVAVITVAGRLPEANRAGRQEVTAEYFTFLDDDDYLLPQAIGHRLHAADGADLVVSNGFVDGSGRRTLHMPDAAAIARDPFSALGTLNWLHNCAGLYRASSFPVSFFEGIPNDFEWTWLAYKAVVTGKDIRFLDEPDYVYADTGGSMSKSRAFLDAELNLYAEILSFGLSAERRRMIREKQAKALHAASDRARSASDRKAAWRYHLASLILPGGVRYLPYTRKLL